MDETVKLAMAKWPNVPHCYGWLALDARGHWRMRDERAQALGLPGDKLSNPALRGFIERNYACDERGCWFFQNGPQRVYVDIETMPFVARTDPAAGDPAASDPAADAPAAGFVLHTGAALAPTAAWLTPGGRFILADGATAAALDDRDAGACLALLEHAGKPLDDELLLRWMEGAAALAGGLTLRTPAGLAPVERIEEHALAQRFGFVRTPRA